MAYRDKNGTITIDEVAANRDIQRINQAIPKLRDSRTALVNLQRQAAVSKGLTGLSIHDKAGELIRMVDRQLTQLEETTALIKKTVITYQILDKKIRDMINAAIQGPVIMK